MHFKISSQIWAASLLSLERCQNKSTYVLVYHILVGLETRLRRQGDHHQWSTIRSILKTHQRVLHAEDELIQISVSGTPEAAHQEIYQKLGVRGKLKRIKTLGAKSL